MPQFGFYKVGGDEDSALTILVASSVEDAKRQARAAIEAEGLEAARLWVDGQKTIEVRRPARPAPTAPAPQTDDRGARMAERKAEGATQRAIGAEFGISAARVREVMAASQRRATMREEQPNRAALTIRARNALRYVITETEDDPAERDRLLPGRLAALTRRDLGKVPNLGQQTIAELETWLWERGLTLDG